MSMLNDKLQHRSKKHRRGAWQAIKTAVRSLNSRRHHALQRSTVQNRTSSWSLCTRTEPDAQVRNQCSNEKTQHRGTNLHAPVPQLEKFSAAVDANLASATRWLHDVCRATSRSSKCRECEKRESSTLRAPRVIKRVLP